eukprot:3944190-Alexandrium_andersonii.AAC.1
MCIRDRACSAAVQARVIAGRRVLFLVDAPTSKHKVVLSLMDEVDKMKQAMALEKSAVMVTCGARLDLMTAVTNKAATLWPRAARYVVQLVSADVQRPTQRPTFIVYAAHPEVQAQVPFVVDALAA